MPSIRQLVILAGGKGTRLGEHARSTPKPMMAITEQRVFLDYIIENAARQGFVDILIVAGHLGDQISARYHHAHCNGANISVFVEPEARGTAGALTFIGERLAGAFLVTNGDTFFDINFRALASKLEGSPHFDAAIALRTVEDVGRYGSVEANIAGLVTEFREKDESRLGQQGVINGGVYAIRHRALSTISKYPASIETDLFPYLVKAGTLGSVRVEGYFIDIGLPETLERCRIELPRRRRAALFLDRDGVLNRDINYLHRREDWQWIDGAKEAIRAANDAGHAVIVITNQAGIGRGKYRECDAVSLHAWMQEELHAFGAFVDAIYLCPYHPDAVAEAYRIQVPFDRKPEPAMLLRAARQHDLDLSRCLFVGDQSSDAAAADAAGVTFLHFNDGNLHRKILSDEKGHALFAAST
ncbi:HAD-IIIA family hydrolase [Sphingobium mellinum]|uniref:HAD-IIIA family hydrolase n=1 Tax=Sphingobium mellinum TaxID=1387166 RepID=UPI0030EE860A